jgi:hypothetical protein
MQTPSRPTTRPARRAGRCDIRTVIGQQSDATSVSFYTFSHREGGGVKPFTLRMGTDPASWVIAETGEPIGSVILANTRNRLCVQYFVC